MDHKHAESKAYNLESQLINNNIHTCDRLADTLIDQRELKLIAANLTDKLRRALGPSYIEDRRRQRREKVMTEFVALLGLNEKKLHGLKRHKGELAFYLVEAQALGATLLRDKLDATPPGQCRDFCYP